MRLFIALLPDADLVAYLGEQVSLLKAAAKSGTFTHSANLHITLAFLGEQKNAQAAEEALEELRFAPFSFALGAIGLFKQEKGDTIWMGAQASAQMTELHKQLARALMAHGLPVEKRRFHPHMTFGRQVVLGKPLEMIAFAQAPHDFSVDAVSLMRSDRYDGRLVYTEVSRVHAMTAED